MTTAAAKKTVTSELRDVTQNDKPSLVVVPRISSKTVTQLTVEIEQKAKAADDNTLVAAMALRELRKLVEAGAIGAGVKWFAWARKNIRIREARLYRLQAIAEADDPNAELERIRKQDRERAKRYRQKKKKIANGIALERERIELIRWSENTTILNVRRVLGFIREGTA